jgi:dephospho-CoA kinase
MRTLIITGGIATGKSSFLSVWCDCVPASVGFCADDEVKALYEEAAVVKWIGRNIGAGCINEEGKVDRGVLREVVFADAGLRKVLEGYVHPKVRARCREVHRQMREGGGVEWMLVDIPLYYESGQEMPFEVDAVVVVAGSDLVRDTRLQMRNGFDNGLTESILKSQMGIEAKMAAADHVVWNDGGLNILRRQAAAMSRLLR